MKACLAGAGLLAGVLALSGCASLSAPDTGIWRGAGPPLSDCLQWMDALDLAVAAAGVRDAQDTPVSGFAQLRASRLSDAYRVEAARDP